MTETWRVLFRLTDKGDIVVEDISLDGLSYSFEDLPPHVSQFLLLDEPPVIANFNLYDLYEAGHTLDTWNDIEIEVV